MPRRKTPPEPPAPEPKKAAAGQEICYQRHYIPNGKSIYEVHHYHPVTRAK
jgi:hypothetical protein